MFGKDKALDKFYSNLCDVLLRRNAYPALTLVGHVDGECRGCGGSHVYSLMHEIAEMFWKHAPDLKPDLALLAGTHGFDVEELHDIMVGVFIGGDGTPSHRSPIPKTP